MKPTIWALFNVANEYDQPDHNLRAWWPARPQFEVLVKAMGGSMQQTDAILAAANVFQGYEAPFADYCYWMEQIAEGEVVAERPKCTRSGEST